MTEHKNTILAIVLSLVVVVGWQYFVGYPQMEKQRHEALLKQQEQAHQQPGASQPGAAQRRYPGAASRPGHAPPVPGGSAAPGAAPSGGPRGKAVVTHRRACRLDRRGLTAASISRARASTILRSSNIARPSIPARRRSCCSRRRARRTPITRSSAGCRPRPRRRKCRVPTLSGSRKAAARSAADHPVTLSYDNGEGLIFRRTIAVDDHYLFTIRDEVQNKSEQPGHACFPMGSSRATARRRCSATTSCTRA